MDAVHEFKKALKSNDSEIIYDICKEASKKIFGYCNDDTTISILCYILMSLDIDYKFPTLYDFIMDQSMQVYINQLAIFDDHDLYPEITTLFEEMRSILSDY